MLSPTTKSNISRIIPFGAIWLLFSIIYAILEKGLLGNLNYYPPTGNPYNFTRNMFIIPTFALVSGLLIGTTEILYFDKLFIQISFSKKIFYKSGIYLAIIVLFLALLTALANSIELASALLAIRVWHNVWAFFTNYASLSVGIYMAAIIVVSLFYSEVSQNIGQGVLANFLTGKYHSPTVEERIFMFLDMKSSTTIAEKIGHVRYFEMLREYYADLSEPIIRFSGEIYQYVGDEIVVSWELKSGLENNNCIQCFFAMKAAISNQRGKYHEKFGLLPQFKAGFHLGKVTTGEIGVLKKEIIFTGDVLNTTARIQGLCNFYQIDVLISDELRKKLRLDAHFQIKAVEETQLRGKNEKIDLYTILSC